ncbi:MAG: hypothetical protein ACHQAX_04030 [Gammaproteobacteria bacterium]
MRNYNELIPIAEAFKRRFSETHPHWHGINPEVIVVGSAALYHFMDVTAPQTASWTLALVSSPDRSHFDISRNTIGPMVHGNRAGLSKPSVLNKPYGHAEYHRNFFHWIEEGVCHSIGMPYMHSNFELVFFVNEYYTLGVIDTPHLGAMVINAPTNKLALNDLVYVLQSYHAAIDVKRKLNQSVSLSPLTAEAIKLLMTAPVYSEVKKLLQKKYAALFPTAGSLEKHIEDIETLADPLVAAERLRQQAAMNEMALRAIALDAEKEASAQLKKSETINEDLSQQIEAQQREIEALKAMLATKNTKEAVKSETIKQTQKALQSQIESLSGDKKALLSERVALKGVVETLETQMAIKTDLHRQEIHSLNGKIKRLEKEHKQEIAKTREAQHLIKSKTIPTKPSIDLGASEAGFDAMLDDLNAMISSLDAVELKPSRPVNEFEIPHFTSKIILLRLKEVLGAGRQEKPFDASFMDDKTYDRLKHVVIEMESSEPQAFTQLVQMLQKGKFIVEHQERQDVLDEGNIFLSVMCLLKDNIDIFDGKTNVNAFYSNAAKIQAAYMLSRGITPYSQHEDEVAVLEQVQFLQDFYHSNLGRDLCDEVLTQKLGLLSEDSLNVVVCMIKNMFTHAVGEDQPSFDKDMSNAIIALNQMSGDEKAKHENLTQDIRGLLSKSTIAPINGLVGQWKFVWSMFQFNVVLSRTPRSQRKGWASTYHVAWLSLNTICLTHADKSYFSFEKRTSHVYTMLNIFLRFAQDNPSLLDERVVKNAERVLTELYNADGTYKHEVGKLVNTLKKFTEFFISRVSLIKKDEHARNTAEMIDAYKQYMSIASVYQDNTELDDVISCAEGIVIKELQSNAVSNKQMDAFIEDMLSRVESVQKAVVQFSKPVPAAPSLFASQAENFAVDNAKAITELCIGLRQNSNLYVRLLKDSDELIYVQYDRMLRLFLLGQGQPAEAFEKALTAAYHKKILTTHLISKGINPQLIFNSVHQIMNQLNAGFLKLKQAVFDAWIADFQEAKPEDLQSSLKIMFEKVRKHEPSYCTTPVAILCFFVKCFRHPKTGKSNEKFLIDDRLLVSMTPLCDLDKAMTVSDAIADFKKQNIFGMNSKEMKNEAMIRAVLLEIMVEYQETNSKLTDANHQRIAQVIEALKTAPSADKKSTQRRK